MKKAICILLCAAAALSVSTSALATEPSPAPGASPMASVTPRYATIDKTSERVSKEGTQMKCVGTCITSRDVNVQVTITVRDNQTGAVRRGTPGKGQGKSFSHTARFSAEKGHKYTVTFTYSAGGETVEKTKSYTAS